MLKYCFYMNFCTIETTFTIQLHFVLLYGEEKH